MDGKSIYRYINRDLHVLPRLNDLLSTSSTFIYPSRLISNMSYVLIFHLPMYIVLFNMRDPADPIQGLY